jgi:hypothetical protein
MNDWKKLGCTLVGSVAIFALAGCGQASAGGKTVDQPRPAAAVVAMSDAHAIADADADNGPGCAESALNVQGQKATHK